MQRCREDLVKSSRREGVQDVDPVPAALAACRAAAAGCRRAIPHLLRV